jgi:two-component system cell cycle sensor histidine kinase/response regulator CckA
VAIVREMVEDVLVEQGYAVYAFSDGKSALEWFESHHTACDLIILDMAMPEMNGSECYSVIKTMDPNCKTIITSGHAIDDETNRLLADGAVTFLQKPYDISSLIATVQEALAM